MNETRRKQLLYPEKPLREKNIHIPTGDPTVDPGDFPTVSPEDFFTVGLDEFPTEDIMN
jgi:hypothetical protein